MKFPGGKYGRQWMEFFPAPYRSPLRAFAGLVFPWDGDCVVLANIFDRGWCIPSGRVEAGESSEEAVLREAKEEAGIVVCDLTYLGCYRLSDRQEVRWADVFVGEVCEKIEITAVEESLGRMWATMAELPKVYHLWTPLTEAVFGYSWEVIQRRRALRG